MKESRAENAERNVVSAFVFQALNLIIKFGLRTVFIYTLGKEYLGVSGVFSNVISLLSLSELGLGMAILYDMYSPIARDDQETICSLVTFYRTIFTIIGVFIISVGLLLIPF